MSTVNYGVGGRRTFDNHARDVEFRAVSHMNERVEETAEEAADHAGL